MVTAGLGAPDAPGQPAGHGTGRFRASNQRPAARGGRGGRAAVEPGPGPFSVDVRSIFGRFSMIFNDFRSISAQFAPFRASAMLPQLFGRAAEAR